jgi:hypothetical protein
LFCDEQSARRRFHQWLKPIDCALSARRAGPDKGESKYHHQFPPVEWHCSPFLSGEKLSESRIDSEDVIDCDPQSAIDFAP